MYEAAIEMAKRHLQEGEQRVDRRRGLVAELRAHGHATGLAEELLREFEATLDDQAALLAWFVALTDLSFRAENNPMWRQAAF